MAPDDAEQTIMVGRLDYAVTNRDSTGRSRWLTAARRWPGDGADGSHGPGAEVPRSRTPTPPIRIARAGLLDPVARNRIRFIEIAILFRQSASNIPTQETAPPFLNDGCPAEIL